MAGTYDIPKVLYAWLPYALAIVTGCCCSLYIILVDQSLCCVDDTWCNRILIWTSRKCCHICYFLVRLEVFTISGSLMLVFEIINCSDMNQRTVVIRSDEMKCFTTKVSFPLVLICPCWLLHVLCLYMYV